MNRWVLGFVLVFFLLSGIARAEIYQWIDKEGNFHFTDDSTNIPGRYRNRTIIRNDDSHTSTKQEMSPLEQKNPLSKTEAKEEDRKVYRKHEISLQDFDISDFKVFWSLKEGIRELSYQYLYKNISDYTIGPFSTKFILLQAGKVVKEMNIGELPIRKPNDHTFATGSFPVELKRELEWSNFDIDFYITYDNTSLLAKKATLPYTRLEDIQDKRDTSPTISRTKGRKRTTDGTEPP